MGQRTQVLQIIKTDLPNLDTQLSFGQFVHHQWGFGKVMPLLLLGQLTRLYSTRIYGSDNKDPEGYKSETKKMFKSFCDFMRIDTENTDYSPCSRSSAYNKKAINACLKATYNELPKVINQFGDNNDGYMVIVLTIRPDNKFKSYLDIEVESAFITNSEKNPSYLTANQYMQSYIGSEDRFSIGKTITALDCIASYFDDDWQKTPNQWANYANLLTPEQLATLKPFETIASKVITPKEAQA